jgi:pimeloyl-ACP methyl ester carboxylesterase
MTGLIFLLAIGLAILWVLGIVYTLWSLTHPPRRTYASAIRKGQPGDPSELDEPRGYSEWSFQSRAKKLAAWDIVGDNPAGPVCIYTHGWGNAKTDALVRLDPIIAHCSRIIAWDQPGHGESSGSCDMGVGEVDDLIVLAKQLSADTPLLFYGWSMGAGVSIAAAATLGNVAAVIAESPYRIAYTPAKNVVSQAAMPWRLTLNPGFWLMGLIRRRTVTWASNWPEFDRAERAKELTCPLLVVHGDQDLVSPFQDGKDIADAAPEGTLLTLENAGHNGIWTDDETRSILVSEIRGFLDRALPDSQP